MFATAQTNAAIIINNSPNNAALLCSNQISQPRIVNKPNIPINKPINCLDESFSPKYFTANKLLHNGMEYKRTDDFPASTNFNPYITSKNTAAVCNKPTTNKCLQYCFFGIPSFINVLTISNVRAPTLDLNAVKVNGPINSRDAFICTPA